MTEKKLSFSQKYPNHRMQRKNEKIITMTPATHWYKRHVDDEGNTWTEAVAFFCFIEYEERSVWDGGYSQWEKQTMVYAHGARGDEWGIEYVFCMGDSGVGENLFFDPDFRLSHDDQLAGDLYVQEMREWYANLKETKKTA